MRLYSHAERPELVARRDELGEVWDEFMYHDAVAGDHWDRQYEDFPDLQLFLLDEDDRLLAESNAVPIPFGPEELPDEGWDAALSQAGSGPTRAVSAIAISIGVEHRGEGLSTTMLDAMRTAAAARGVGDLVAPVRPNRKHLYPLTPIERYVEWRREDGLLFDPWLRTHERAGATLIRVAPRSMRIAGTVASWEGWTGLRFPDSGEYVVPGALVPVAIDVDRDEGVYVEPNVWMHHRLQRS
jgi:GNAT superfamily N-acetyltransferase